MRIVFRTFLRGLVITAPLILTVYVCARAITWLDGTMRQGLEQIGVQPVPGLGLVITLAVVYLIGLLARTWLFRQLVELTEAVLDRIPLVKSLYSATRDLAQFLGGTDAKSKGAPVRLKLFGDQVHMIALVTQREPETFMGEAERGRVAVYVPMSYQIGGYTLYVRPDQLEEIEGMTVETAMKASMTAGVGAHGRAGDETAQPGAAQPRTPAEPSGTGRPDEDSPP